MSEIKLRLTGADRFISPRIKGHEVVTKGTIVVVPEEDAGYLMGLSHLDTLNNEHPLFEEVIEFTDDGEPTPAKVVAKRSRRTQVAEAE